MVHLFDYKKKKKKKKKFHLFLQLNNQQSKNRL